MDFFQKGRKYKRLTIISSIIILSILPFITYGYWLPEVAEYLIVEDKLMSADVIVAISGRSSRYKYAVRLFKEGYANFILFNYNGEDMFDIVGEKINPEEKIRNFAKSNNIPLDRIFIDSRCTSTYEDMVYTKENIIKNRFKSAIIVSNNFHMLRVSLTYKKVFKGTDIKPVFAPVPMEIDGISPKGWWTRESDLIKVFEEYVKLVFYYFKYLRN